MIGPRTCMLGTPPGVRGLFLAWYLRSWKATSGCKEGSIDSPQHFMVLVIAMTYLMSFPPTFTPTTINTRNDGRIAGRTPITTTATHGFYADDTAMIAGRSDVGAHNPNDMVACIPGDWLVAAKSESECSAPQLEATGYASRTAVSSPSRPLPRRPVPQPPPRDESATSTTSTTPLRSPSPMTRSSATHSERRTERRLAASPDRCGTCARAP